MREAAAPEREKEPETEVFDPLRANRKETARSNKAERLSGLASVWSIASVNQRANY
jgi:hypothetical protein